MAINKVIANKKRINGPSRGQVRRRESLYGRLFFEQKKWADSMTIGDRFF